VKSASIVLKINKCFDIIRGGEGREARYQNMEVRDSNILMIFSYFNKLSTRIKIYLIMRNITKRHSFWLSKA
jgi:hypothetical protein